MTLFGTSAKFIDAVAKAGLRPRETHALGTRADDDVDRIAAGARELRLRLRARQARHPPGVDLRRHRHRQLLRRRQPDRPGVARRDPVPRARHGRGRVGRAGPAGARAEGELVCTTPFPSMPVGFWNDPDGAKYHAAYFERFPGVWTPRRLLRADGARRRHHLRPIRRRAESRRRPHRHRGDLPPGRAAAGRSSRASSSASSGTATSGSCSSSSSATACRSTRRGSTPISAHIRRNTTPRHVPARIVQVSEIPRTKSGKIVELAVRDVRARPRRQESRGAREPRSARPIQQPGGASALMDDAVILSACRTPDWIVRRRVQDLSAADLGAVVIREAIGGRTSRPADLGDVIMGCVLQAGAGMNVARQAAHQGRGAGGGARRKRSIASAAPASRRSCTRVEAVKAGFVDLVLAGGTGVDEQRAPYLLKARAGATAWGTPKRSTRCCTKGSRAPINGCHMGMTAEEVGEAVRRIARRSGRLRGREPGARRSGRSPPASSSARSFRSTCRRRGAPRRRLRATSIRAPGRRSRTLAAVCARPSRRTAP